MRLLSEIATIYSGNSIPQKKKEELFCGLDFGTPYVATKDVGSDHSIQYENGVLIPETHTDSFKLAPANSVLICAEGGSAGKKVAHTDKDIHFVNKLFCVHPNEEMISKYIFYYFLSADFQLDFNNQLTGLIGGVSLKKFKNLCIPYTTLDEQKRIVTLLDTVFADLEQTRAKTEQNLKNARELFDGSLQQAFSPKGDEWVDKHLEDVLLDKPRNGWSPPAKNHSDIGIPVLTLSAVTGFRFNKHKIKFTSATTKVDAHYWVKNGDLLITRSNTPALVGHVAICSNIEIPTIYPDLIMKLKLDAEKVDVKFIYYQLRSKKLRKIITSSAQGANPTMKKINQEIVQSLPLRYPSIKRQVEIVLELDSIYAATNKLEQIYRNKLDSLNELKKSILQKAFSGELTAKAE